MLPPVMVEDERVDTVVDGTIEPGEVTEFPFVIIIELSPPILFIPLVPQKNPLVGQVNGVGQLVMVVVLHTVIVLRGCSVAELDTEDEGVLTMTIGVRAQP